MTSVRRLLEVGKNVCFSPCRLKLVEHLERAANFDTKKYFLAFYVSQNIVYSPHSKNLCPGLNELILKYIYTIYSEL